MKKLLQQSFFAGILFLLPIAITLWIVLGVLDLTDSIVHRIFPMDQFPFSIPGFGFVMTVIFITTAGFVARNFLGRFLFFWVEKLLAAIPVINRVHITVKQVVETLFKSKGEQFNSVVLIEFPKEGQWAIGFVTSHVPISVEQVHPDRDKELKFVFVPTAPNPTSGFLMAVEIGKMIHVEMSVEDAFKLIISGGIVHPSLSTSQGLPPAL